MKHHIPISNLAKLIFYLFLVFCLLSFRIEPTYAHRVNLFAYVEGDTVFVQDIALAPSTGGTRTASDVAFSPDGAFMYVSDMMNGQVWILDAKTYEELGAIGRNGRYPGQFIWLHSVAVDSQGNIYTTEVNTGRRVQRFVFTGVK